MPDLKTFSLISLGCSKNLVDTEVYLSVFKKHGFEYTTNPKKAEIVLINTCGFILDATKESIKTILKTAEYKKRGLKHLIVAGCLVNKEFDELSKNIPEVDMWIQVKDFQALDKYLCQIYSPLLTTTTAQYQRDTLLTPPHYAYLRISDGCSNQCSYCTIPSIRGSHASVEIEQLLAETERLANKGVKELIITAQDTALYGVDIYGKPSLYKLLQEIEKQKSFAWIRLLYLHPAHLTVDLIDSLSNLPSLLPYFDIPLQHVNNDILSAMNRKIEKRLIIHRLCFIRQVFNDPAIRTTLITGFPGEKREHFNELLAFIQDTGFARMGVFTYSPEKGTPAYEMLPKVSHATAIKRKNKLMATQKILSEQYLKTFIGKTLPVIIDKKSSHSGYDWVGRSYMDSPDIDGKVYVTGDDVNIGDIIPVKITESMEYDLVGVRSAE